MRSFWMSVGFPDCQTYCIARTVVRSSSRSSSCLTPTTCHFPRHRQVADILVTPGLLNSGPYGSNGLEVLGGHAQKLLPFFLNWRWLAFPMAHGTRSSMLIRSCTRPHGA